MPLRVLADANVLYSRTLRDWLALLELNSKGRMYAVYWTEDILAETLYHLRRDHPEWDGARVTAIRERVEKTFSGGQVTDFTVDGSFPGRDRNDQHVHAAAVACPADVVLTNDKDFNDLTADPDQLPYEVLAPDPFFLLVDDSAPRVVREVTRKQTVYWSGKNGRAPLPHFLEQVDCPEFAERVRKHQSCLTL